MINMNDKEIPSLQGLVCPVPLTHAQQIVMGHGSGGKMSHDLIKRLFMPPFDNPALRPGNDSGLVAFETGLESVRLAISTDSHVVAPLFFPGGDIGKLAVCGTVNDVAMMGAKPLYITAGFILEEGLEISLLEKVVSSMQSAAREAGVEIIAGDTKVVQRGRADGLYITTSGVGVVRPGVEIGGEHARPGDLVILSGSIGDHGIAVLSARGDLGFETDVISDIAPLNSLVSEVLDACPQVHVFRDPTRGGLATTLNEIAIQSSIGINLDESSILVHPGVRAACEMLGFDPLYIANEGKLVCVLPGEYAGKVIDAMRHHPYGKEAAIIGEVQAAPKSRVLMRTSIGSTRIVDMLAGEMLPRIC